MGLHSNVKNETSDNRRAKASKKRGSRLDDFNPPSHTGGADWSSCDPALLRDMVVLITDLGGAVTIGMSRDQGAHSITLMLDDVRKSIWIAGDADLDETLRDIIGKLQAQT